MTCEIGVIVIPDMILRCVTKTRFATHNTTDVGQIYQPLEFRFSVLFFHCERSWAVLIIAFGPTAKL